MVGYSSDLVKFFGGNMKKLLIGTAFFALSEDSGWAQDFYGYVG